MTTFKELRKNDKDFQEGLKKVKWQIVKYGVKYLSWSLSLKPLEKACGLNEFTGQITEVSFIRGIFQGHRLKIQNINVRITGARIAFFLNACHWLLLKVVYIYNLV